MRSLLAALILLPSLALAVPLQLPHQGRLLDSTGVALDGPHDLSVALFDAETGGSELWRDDFAATNVEAGYFSLALGSGEPLDAAALSPEQVWVELSVNGDAPLSRVRLLSVPYAIHAGTASSVDGGVVDASEIRVNGEVVIDGDGDLVGGSGSDDTLSGLACSDGDVARFNGTAWDCASGTESHTHSGGDIVEGTVAVEVLPVGDSPGTVAAGDHTHGFGDLTGQVSSDQLPDDLASQIGAELGQGPLALAAGSTVDGAPISTGAHFTADDAVAAMGDKDPSNPLNHDAYTDADAVAAVEAEAISLAEGSEIGGVDVKRHLELAAFRSICYGGAASSGNSQFSVIMRPYNPDESLHSTCQGINNGWFACGVAKANYHHQNCGNILNTSYGGGYSDFSRASYAQARINDGSYSSCTSENMMVCCATFCNGW